MISWLLLDNHWVGCSLGSMLFPILSIPWMTVTSFLVWSSTRFFPLILTCLLLSSLFWSSLGSHTIYWYFMVVATVAFLGNEISQQTSCFSGLYNLPVPLLMVPEPWVQKLCFRWINWGWEPHEHLFHDDQLWSLVFIVALAQHGLTLEGRLNEEIS